MQESVKLTKQERRLLRKQNKNPSILKLKEIQPLTENQRISFDNYRKGKNLLLHGTAGTGKSFISLYLSLKEVLNETGPYDQVVIIRSAVPTRDMGFLPGSLKEKSEAYEAPYYAICNELFDDPRAYEILKGQQRIRFMTTSHVRGITLNNCVVIVDEIANMTLHELDSIITRVGQDCRIIFSGDFKQSDFTRHDDRKGLKEFMRIIRNMHSFEFVDFCEEDIVRSGLVKSYIIEKEKLGICA